MLISLATIGDAVRAAHLFTISAAIAASRPVYQHSLYARKEISLALVHRASAYMALDNVVGALTDAETAIRINRPEPRGHLRKGRALVALGRPDEALDAYNLGLAFNSDNEVCLSYILYRGENIMYLLLYIHLFFHSSSSFLQQELLQARRELEQQ